MHAEMKNGSIVEIDTTCLFNDQYNTMDGRRIFDGEIKRIMDDIRGGYGKCRYCGALVKVGEAEKHFHEREQKSCDSCFWYREKLQGREKSSETIKNDGERKTIVKITETYCKECSFCDSSSYRKTNCTNTECRAYGIEWFTPENTFFLRYPNGFESVPEWNKLRARGFNQFRTWNENGDASGDYCKKLGSYYLSVSGNSKTGSVEYYTIRNCRRHYNFKFSDGKLFVLDYKFGWKERKTLDGVLPSVMADVKKICNH